MRIVGVPNGPVATNAWVLADDDGIAVVIDPGYEPQLIDRLVVDRGWKVRAIVATHGHFDHVAGCREAREIWAAPLWMHPLSVPIATTCDQHAQWFGLTCEPCPEPDDTIEHGDVLEIGALELEVRFTPGHSPGCVSLVTADCAIVGDTLFAGSIGRTDLPHSDHERLMRSIGEQLMTLPDETEVFPGHGETTTIGEERTHNPFRFDFLSGR